MDKERLIQKGLPDDFLDNCTYCNGSGNDGGGYGACPDCQSTGMKYGKYAEQFIEEEMELCFNMDCMVKRVLVEHHGFHREEYIPKHVNEFLYTYLGHFFKDYRYLENLELAEAELLSELPSGTIRNPEVIGVLMPNGHVGIYTGKPDEFSPILETYTQNPIAFQNELNGIFKVQSVPLLEEYFSQLERARKASGNLDSPMTFNVSFDELIGVPEEIALQSPAHFIL